LFSEPDRLPRTRAITLSPFEMIALTRVRRTLPTEAREDRAWMAEHVCTRIGKEGLEFDSGFWMHPALMGLTTGAASGPRPTFIVAYDASAQARGALNHVQIHQQLRTGERQFICEAVRRDTFGASHDVAEYLSASDAYLRTLLAKRALAEHEQVRIVSSVEETNRLVLAQAARERTGTRERLPARVATPVDATQSRETRRRRERDDALVASLETVPTTVARRRRGATPTTAATSAPDNTAAAPAPTAPAPVTTSSDDRRPARGAAGLLALLAADSAESKPLDAVPPA